MKKSLIALAVSSAVVAPASVQAAEVYGFVNTTIESTSTDNGGSSAIYNTNGDDSGLGLSDTAGSRFGITGSEDLGNGLTAGYTFEFDVGTSSGGSGGSTNEDAGVSTRLANVTLGGDFGTVKMGTQWGVLYEYAGWNHYRSDGHGGATHYYMMSPFSGPFQTGGTTGAPNFAPTDGDPSGLRIDNALSYTYGGGGYSSDPFTFTVQLQADGNGENQTQLGAGIDDEETIDTLIIGAQGTFGDFTVNGTFFQENNTDSSAVSVREPSMFTLGGRWSSGPFYVGGTFFAGDNDLQGGGQGDSPTAFNILGGMDFGGGYSGMLGVGAGDADTNNGAGDMNTVFLQAEKAFSSRTKIYGEFETVTIDGGASADPEVQVLALGVKHSF